MWRYRDIDFGEWGLDTKGDRVRDVAFTARIHDPPLGAGRTAKCVATQECRLHPDGTFSLDASQVRRRSALTQTAAASAAASAANRHPSTATQLSVALRLPPALAPVHATCRMACATSAIHVQLCSLFVDSINNGRQCRS